MTGFTSGLRWLLTFVIIGALLFIAQAQTSPADHYQFVDEKHKTGLISADCWFTPADDWPEVACYRFQAPENHSEPSARLITFPLAIFRSRRSGMNKSPVLHLGAGGPGAPMYFDSTETMNEFWRAHDALSINLGRDLWVIDPRGTGLSEPLLSCGRFVDNELARFRYNFSIGEERAEVDKDYYQCIDDFLARGVDFSRYNSFSIAEDVELLRRATKVKQWILIGVSYGAVYAQAIVDLYPQSVEAMVLDSAAIARLKLHDSYLERVVAPFEKLFDYCSSDPDCRQPVKNIRERIWALYGKLSNEPILIHIDNPITGNRDPFVLNGERFLAALIQGIYGTDIFVDLPLIVRELESGDYGSLFPYLMQYVDYMLDRTYGDVSAIAHYCFEDKPFTDFELMKSLNDQLPQGYIRDTVKMAMEWDDYCDEMRITTGAQEMLMSTPTAVPTLFLHGRLDSVTRLVDIEENLDYFTNHRLVTFDLAHSILTSSECGEIIAAKFIDDKSLQESQLVCY